MFYTQGLFYKPFYVDTYSFLIVICCVCHCQPVPRSLIYVGKGGILPLALSPIGCSIKVSASLTFKYYAWKEVAGSDKWTRFHYDNRNYYCKFFNTQGLLLNYCYPLRLSLSACSQKSDICGQGWDLTLRVESHRVLF